MSHHTSAETQDNAPPVEESPWADTPDYPHRIENHVKVYLHLEETEALPVLATAETAPAGTRVFRRTANRDTQRGTVTGWTTGGTGVFVSFDQGGTYAGPTFDALWIDTGTAGSTSFRWVVSPVSVDGYPLDGVEDGHYCDYEGHPAGARPDRDRQHREAANVDLPTAEELLPLLITALGGSAADLSASQHTKASALIAEHTLWRADRADLSAGEAAGDFPASSDWHDSDDAGCDLADRAIALLVELNGNHSHTARSADPAGAVAALQRSQLQGSAPAGVPSARAEPESPSRSEPGLGR